MAETETLVVEATGCVGTLERVILGGFPPGGTGVDFKARVVSRCAGYILRWVPWSKSASTNPQGAAPAGREELSSNIWRPIKSGAPCS